MDSKCPKNVLYISDLRQFERIDGGDITVTYIVKKIKN